MKTHRRTVLQEALRKRRSRAVIFKLIEIGDRCLVMKTSRWSFGQTALHTACECQCQASVKVSLKLIEIGGRELVMKKCQRSGETALHTVCKRKTSMRTIVFRTGQGR